MWNNKYKYGVPRKTKMRNELKIRNIINGKTLSYVSKNCKWVIEKLMKMLQVIIPNKYLIEHRSYNTVDPLLEN